MRNYSYQRVSAFMISFEILASALYISFMCIGIFQRTQYPVDTTPLLASGLQMMCFLCRSECFQSQLLSRLQLCSSRQARSWSYGMLWLLVLLRLGGTMWHQDKPSGPSIEFRPLLALSQADVCAPE